MYIKYQIGSKSFTNKLPLYSDNFINKQLKLSIPLITGAIIEIPSKEELKIRVGKEINLDNIISEKYKLSKYDIDLDDLALLRLQGYQRACLLNYKKYDQLIVGIKDDEIIVNDYFALKSIIQKLQKISVK